MHGYHLPMPLFSACIYSQSPKYDSAFPPFTHQASHTDVQACLSHQNTHLKSHHKTYSILVIKTQPATLNRHAIFTDGQVTCDFVSSFSTLICTSFSLPWNNLKRSHL